MTSPIECDRSKSSPINNATGNGTAVIIRAATTEDATRVYDLINENLVSGHLLARPLREIELHVPHFLVATNSNDVIGCAELVSLTLTVAEIRSLVVTADHRGRGVGGRLLEALVAQAVSQHVPRVCAFTHQPQPFIHAGFSIVPHPWVSEKIATDCQGCDLFLRCNQYAVILDLKQPLGETA